MEQYRKQPNQQNEKQDAEKDTRQEMRQNAESDMTWNGDLTTERNMEQNIEQNIEQKPVPDTGQSMEQNPGSAKDPLANYHNPVHAPIPGLGLRSMKTALAAMLTAMLYAFFPDSNPTFACIGAIFGMGADMEDSRRSGGNRFFGTIIGGFIGLGLYWLEHQIFPEGCYWLRLPLVFLGIVVMISMCVLFHWPGGVQPGGVVLCIILFNTPAHHIDYAIHRMIDTGVGVVIALLVNYLLPRNKLEHWFHLDQMRKKKEQE